MFNLNRKFALRGGGGGGGRIVYNIKNSVECL